MNDLRPMLATGGQPPRRFADFAVEAKYDGLRGIAFVDGGEVTLVSRNGAEITRTFPEITAALAITMARDRLILDGEIVALNDTGVPCFRRLQQRWPQNRRPTADLLRRVPARFFVFDVLRFDGRDITRKPYQARRNRLTELAASRTSTVVQFPGSWTDIDPQSVLAASAELGLEGVVCKRLDSIYTPGLRSRDWIKTPTEGEANSSLVDGCREWVSTGTLSELSLSAPTPRRDGCNSAEWSAPAWAW